MEEKLKLLSRAMQAVMLAVIPVGFLTGNYTWVPAAAISLVITEIPSLLNRDLKLVLPAKLNFLLVLALFLHVFGGASGFYDTVPGWDHVTHAFSSSLVAALGFIVVLSVDQYVKTIFLPKRFLGVVIAMFTMAMGVFWELMEFSLDMWTGSLMQYSLDDTMVDLFFDGAVGIAVAAVGAYYLSSIARDEIVENLGVDKAKEKIVQIVEKQKNK